MRWPRRMAVTACQGDDRWCVISVRDDDEWRAFCRVIGRAELISDARFTDLQTRLAHRTELDDIVRAWTQARPAEEVMTKMQSAGVPAGVVQTGADLLKDPQLRHRNYFSAFADSLIGPFEIPRSGFMFRGKRRRAAAPAEPLRCRQRRHPRRNPRLRSGNDRAMAPGRNTYVAFA